MLLLKTLKNKDYHIIGGQCQMDRLNFMELIQLDGESKLIQQVPILHHQNYHHTQLLVNLTMVVQVKVYVIQHKPLLHF
jgi:hypothetical protein